MFRDQKQKDNETNMATQSPEDFVKYLEHQYSPSRWSKLVDPEEIVSHHCEKTMNASKEARMVTKNELNIKYGDFDGQRMDIFYPKDNETASKVLMFIHGGYWQAMSKDYYSYIGKVFSSFGVIVAVVGYDLAPKVKMETIYNEIRESVIYLYERFSKSKIFISGHSAGGHLAALLLKENWPKFGLSNCPIDGVIAISGVYDLQPLVHTYVNDALKMDEAEARLYSPMQYLEEIKENSDCRVLCLIGEYESDEFHLQSKQFCEGLQSSKINASLRVIKGTDHFSVMHDFLDHGYEGTEIIAKFINTPKDRPMTATW